jgi:hypothetical protein
MLLLLLPLLLVVVNRYTMLLLLLVVVYRYTMLLRSLPHFDCGVAVTGHQQCAASPCPNVHRYTMLQLTLLLLSFPHLDSCVPPAGDQHALHAYAHHGQGQDGVAVAVVPHRRRRHALAHAAVARHPRTLRGLAVAA